MEKPAWAMGAAPTRAELVSYFRTNPSAWLRKALLAEGIALNNQPWASDGYVLNRVLEQMSEVHLLASNHIENLEGVVYTQPTESEAYKFAAQRIRGYFLDCLSHIRAGTGMSSNLPDDDIEHWSYTECGASPDLHGLLGQFENLRRQHIAYAVAYEFWKAGVPYKPAPPNCEAMTELAHETFHSFNPPQIKWTPHVSDEKGEHVSSAGYTEIQSREAFGKLKEYLGANAMGLVSFLTEMTVEKITIHSASIAPAKALDPNNYDHTDVDDDESEPDEDNTP